MPWDLCHLASYNTSLYSIDCFQMRTMQLIWSWFDKQGRMSDLPCLMFFLSLLSLQASSDLIGGIPALDKPAAAFCCFVVPSRYESACSSVSFSSPRPFVGASSTPSGHADTSANLPLRWTVVWGVAGGGLAWLSIICVLLSESFLFFAWCFWSCWIAVSLPSKSSGLLGAVKSRMWLCSRTK